jgi:serine/threonine-protein kinase
MTGETLGNYRLGAKLGSGSMGVVFVGEHQRIARRVAVKFLIPELTRDPLVLQRFFNEARATSLIRHPGIVEVFDCGVDANGRAYIVMEHLEGETLGDRLRRTRKLPWVEATAIAGQVADALGAVHKKRIIHRDLKPENIFLVGDAAAVKVLDFGVAKLQVLDAPIRLTIRGMLMGTPEYMSPEQCKGSEDIDHRADIYALGCILFEMLSGNPPFTTSNVQELMAAHMFRPAPSLAAGGGATDVPVWLGELLARMLAKHPQQRPASMHEVSKTLRERNAPASLTRSTMVVARRPRAQHLQIAAAALAGVLVVAGALWAARGRPAPSRAERAPAVEAIRQAETQQPLPAAAGLLPADTPPLPVMTNEAVAPAPPERTPDRAARPMRRARPAKPQLRHMVDTDGIVDL